MEFVDVPRERCTDSADLDKVVAFQRTCYELHLNEGSSFPKARDYCMKRKGDVWHHVDGNTFDIVSGELERQKSTMKVRERNNFHILPTGFPMI